MLLCLFAGQMQVRPGGDVPESVQPVRGQLHQSELLRHPRAHYPAPRDPGKCTKRNFERNLLQMSGENKFEAILPRESGGSEKGREKKSG